MALGLSSVLGNNLLTISATSMLTAVSILSEAGYGQMAIYTPLAVNLPAVLVVIIMYATVGKKLQDKWFDFEDLPVELESGKNDDNTRLPHVETGPCCRNSGVCCCCPSDEGQLRPGRPYWEPVS